MHSGSVSSRAVTVLPLSPPYYFDSEQSEIGVLEYGLPPRLAGVLARAPTVKPEDVAALAGALERVLPDRSLPIPVSLQTIECTDIEPKPHLYLTTSRVGHRHGRDWPVPTPDILPIARLSFDYGGIRVDAGHPRRELTRLDGDRLVRIARDASAELTYRRHLESFGLVPFASVSFDPVTSESGGHAKRECVESARLGRVVKEGTEGSRAGNVGHHRATGVRERPKRAACRPVGRRGSGVGRREPCRRRS